jgi:DNA-binding transcriptional ArsR family regulator
MKVSLKRLPIFRSPEQARILTEIFVYASEPFSITALADRTGVSAPGVHKEVNRLEEAGLIISSRSGRSRLISANKSSPMYSDLRGLLLKAFGPAELIRHALTSVPRIERAFIYGSWAASEAGSLSRAPRDVDVMILGTPDHDTVARALDGVEEQIGRPINVSIFDPEEWEEEESGFAETVRSGPRVELIE